MGTGCGVLPGTMTRTTAAGRYRSGSAATATPVLCRAVRLGEAWHPPQLTLDSLREALQRMKATAHELRLLVPALAPQIILRLPETPITDPGRLVVEDTSIRSSTTSNSYARPAPKPPCSIRTTATRAGRPTRRRRGTRGERHRRGTSGHPADSAGMAAGRQLR